MNPTLGQRAAGVVHITGGGAPPSVTEDDENLFCCWGSVMGDATDCTCWEPVFEVCQAPPDIDAAPATRAKCCHDCAYRNGSPERADEYEAEALVELASAQRGVFWCHEGMRRPITYRHPGTGREVPADPADYQPAIVGDVAYRADGAPATRCAGWAAHRKVAA